MGALLRRGREVGEGSTAVVREGFLRETSAKVAMKIIGKKKWPISGMSAIFENSTQSLHKRVKCLESSSLNVQIEIQILN